MKRSGTLGSLLAAAASMALATTAAQAQTAPGAKAWQDGSLSPEQRADAVIARLTTLDDKLAALGGAGLAKLGLPPGAMGSDGPAGPTHAPGVPASPPNPLTLAATFDVALAADYGRTVAREFRHAGMSAMLGPTLDVARTWHSGRVPEGLGEDPWLSGAIGAAYIKAAQAEGVAVTLKHYAAYTQEQGRTGDAPFGLKPAVDNIVGERVLREIYMPPFRAAVQDGGALGVMCAFPRINGTYACENPYLLTALKAEWGFRGTVAPDFPDAQRSVVAAVNAGLDQGNFGLPRPMMTGTGQMPTGAVAPQGSPGAAGKPPAAGPPPGMDLGAALGMNRIPGGITLKQAVESGQVPVARLDDMIRRRLVTMFAVGADRPHRPEPALLGGPAAEALAVRVAEAGAVLLKNDRAILPLGPETTSLAVIGWQAGPHPQAVTAGSAAVDAKKLTPIIDAVRARAGAASVTYAAGSVRLDALPPVPAGVLKAPDGSAGLRADYVANPNMDFTGTPLASRLEAGVNVAGPAPVPGLPADNLWSVRWSGTLTPTKTGAHQFTLAGAGSGRLFVDDKLVARFDRVDFGAVGYAYVPLTAGRAAKVRIEWTPREAAPLPGIPMMNTTLGTLVRWGWAEPDGRIEQAVAAAKAAKVALVFVADRHGEGADRSELKLPGDQDALIEAVAAVNPNTVVVLNTAGPVAMPWIGKVRGVMEAWYPGDAIGTATAALLFGDAAPGGRLPMTFPRDDTQGPAVKERNYPGTVGPSGAIEAAYFDEGLRVGYRWYDATGQKPLFAFGHGLTYAPISVGSTTLSAAGDAVSVEVANDGKRADAAVVQVYLGFPGAAGEPPKRLAGIAKVPLAAGERRTVTIALPPTAFQLWDEVAHGWTTPKGRYEVMIGRASDDIVARLPLTR